MKFDGVDSRSSRRHLRTGGWRPLGARVCRPRAHSCPGSTAVGIALCAWSASSFFHGEVTAFGFSRSELVDLRRQLNSSCVGRPALVADLNNPSVGVDASPGGVVVSGRLTRRATLTRNGSRAIRRKPCHD